MAASVSREWDDVPRLRLPERIDLLAVNLDEATALTRVPESAGVTATVTAAIERATATNAGLNLVVTAVNTAGAGDAHLAGRDPPVT